MVATQSALQGLQGGPYTLQYGETNPYLRTPADPITERDTPELHALVNDMPDLMWEYDGVGLAGPQIGVPLRIIATTQRSGTGRKMKHRGDTMMINPEIIETSDEMFVSDEGCLSLPGKEGQCQRYKRIVVQYCDVMGEQYTQTYTGFNAAIVQHEIDHLDGVLFIDKLV